VASYQALLEAEGFLFTSPYGGLETAWRAVDSRRQHYEPKAALLCEYDALEGLGHACGHSLSGAASLLAALALRDAFPSLPLRIDLIGTPDEENRGGKADMARKGAFDGYSFAAMAHMSGINAPLFRALACNDRYYSFSGKAAHASAAPEEGVNALNAARLWFDAMDMRRQHLRPGMQFHGIIAQGGQAPNVVPAHTELNVFYRGLTLADLHALNDIGDTVARAAALATGCSVHWEQRTNDFADMYETPTGGALVRSIFTDMGLDYTEMDKAAGSTDAGNVDYIIPTFQPLVSIAQNGEALSLHTAEFLECVKSGAGLRGLKNAAIILAELCYRLATEETTVEALKREHNSRFDT
jgi:amidohydrolase